MKRFAENLLEEALKQGADAADVYGTWREGMSASVFAGEVDRFEKTQSNGVGLRVIRDGQVGYAYTECMEAPDKVAASALQNAAVTAQNAHAGIYEEAVQMEQAQEKQEYLPSNVINMAKQLYVDTVAMEHAYNVQGCEAEVSYTGLHVANTAGLQASCTRQQAVMVVQPVAKIGEWVDSAYWFDVAKSLDALSTERTAKTAMQRATRYHGAGRIASGKYRALLTGETMADLLETFSPAFSARRVLDGMSMLAGKQFGEIASPLISIVDDPTSPNFLFGAPFDGEGVPGKRKELVKNGVLQMFLHNLETARRMQTLPTGNAARSYQSNVGVAPTNFFVQKGTTPWGMLLQRLQNGVIISEVSGLHAGANPVSGDFSLLAKGFEVQDGAVVRPLEQMVVSGNFFTVLKAVVDVGDEMFYGIPGGSTFASPGVLVEELAVAGS